MEIEFDFEINYILIKIGKFKFRLEFFDLISSSKQIQGKLFS